MKRSATKIYKLIDPRNGDVKYVGQTCVKCATRLSAHINQPHSKKMKQWIAELKEHNLAPVLEVIEDGIYNRQKANELEQHWISFYRKHGGFLLNADPSPRF